MQHLPAIHAHAILAENAQDHSLHGQLDGTMRRAPQAPLEARCSLVHELWRLHHAEAAGTESGMSWPTAIGSRAQCFATPQRGTRAHYVPISWRR